MMIFNALVLRKKKSFEHLKTHIFEGPESALNKINKNSINRSFFLSVGWFLCRFYQFPKTPQGTGNVYVYIASPLPRNVAMLGLRGWFIFDPCSPKIEWLLALIRQLVVSSPLVSGISVQIAAPTKISKLLKTTIKTSRDYPSCDKEMG